MSRIMRALTTALLSLSICLVCSAQFSFAELVPINYSFGNLYQGELDNQFIGKDSYTKDFIISLDGSSHVYIILHSVDKFTVNIYDMDGNYVSSDSNSIKTINDLKTKYTITHSTDLGKGSYRIRLHDPSYLHNGKEPFDFIATAEPIISLGTVTITDVTIPEWGTATVSFSPLSNALGYETQICSDASFSDPKTVFGAEPSVTVPGLTNRINYVRTRAYAAYSDGNKVFSGWSQPRTIIFPKLSNPLKIKGKTAIVKYSKLKKKAQKLSISKTITFANKGKGTLKYAKASGNKKISINKKTGKVTVKKGLKRGIYKVKVKVKAAGNSDYNPSKVKTVTFRIKVR